MHISKNIRNHSGQEVYDFLVKYYNDHGSIMATGIAF